MSIWIDLLFMHGHFATPRHLAELLAPPAADTAQPADRPDESPDAEPEREPEPEIEDAVQTWPLDDVLCDPAPYVRSFPVVHHPFRSVGQLP